VLPFDTSVRRGRLCRLARAGPCHPAYCQPTRDFRLTMHQQGSVHSPLPPSLACDTRRTAPLGLSPETSHPAVTSHARQAEGRVCKQTRIPRPRSSRRSNPTNSLIGATSFAPHGSAAPSRVRPRVSTVSRFWIWSHQLGQADGCLRVIGPSLPGSSMLGRHRDRPANSRTTWLSTVNEDVSRK